MSASVRTLIRRAASFLGPLHGRAVHRGRVGRLTELIAPLLPRGARLLDVGCGDGRLAKALGERVDASGVIGVDIAARQGAAINVVTFDGRRLPLETGSHEAITLVDVLHHAEDPHGLLMEVARVLSPGGTLVIKDHFRFGELSNLVLLAMDIAGNLPQGVLVRGRYLRIPEWIALWSGCELRPIRLEWPARVHRLPWTLIARNELQFVVALQHYPGR